MANAFACALAKALGLDPDEITRLELHPHNGTVDVTTRRWLTEEEHDAMAVVVTTFDLHVGCETDREERIVRSSDGGSFKKILAQLAVDQEQAKELIPTLVEQIREYETRVPHG